MDKVNVYVKGQMWYWDDPICGSKDNKIGVPVNSSLVHYSRYVIVLQNVDTINNGSILVIPCSTKCRQNRDKYDVSINMGPLFNNTTTFARCESIFPASPKSLTRYICTIPLNTLFEFQ